MSVDLLLVEQNGENNLNSASSIFLNLLKGVSLSSGFELINNLCMFLILYWNITSLLVLL